MAEGGELHRSGVEVAGRDEEPAAKARSQRLDRLVGAVARRAACDTLVTSGYFEPHVPALAGYRRTDRRTLEGWAADVYARQ